jgi:hypothetical protein
MDGRVKSRHTQQNHIIDIQMYVFFSLTMVLNRIFSLSIALWRACLLQRVAFVVATLVLGWTNNYDQTTSANLVVALSAPPFIRLPVRTTSIRIFQPSHIDCSRFQPSQERSSPMSLILHSPIGYRSFRLPPRGSSRSGSATKDWDAILAEEEEGSKSIKNKAPFDMRYNQRNCERCKNNYAAIKSAGGPGADIYGCGQASSSESENEEGVFWYLGKVAHISDVSLEQCMSRLWPLIQQHAANLRPLDLFGAVTNEQLDLWCAPIDSEFDVAYNRPTCVFRKMTPNVPGSEAVKVSFVGFEGEVYERDEEGFRTWRYISSGMPSRPEITGPKDEDESDDETDMSAPSDEQMEQLRKALEDKDINELYEEQEQRRKEVDS